MGAQGSTKGSRAIDEWNEWMKEWVSCILDICFQFNLHLFTLYNVFLVSGRKLGHVCEGHNWEEGLFESIEESTHHQDMGKLVILEMLIRKSRHTSQYNTYKESRIYFSGHDITVTSLTNWTFCCCHFHLMFPRPIFQLFPYLQVVSV